MALLAALAVTATVGAGWLAIDRARGRGPAVAPPIDAAPIAIDARAIDAAGPVDAAPVDAAPIAIDARAASAPPPDVRAAPPDARPPAAKGQLRVGADPWGEVFLDGRRLGRAPNQWDVPAGAHVVEVVFPGEAGEVRRRFEIDVPAGERASVFADFKAP
ncbi:MAG: PEGA domain-containing protein [Myxococcales bacterium]|nr:PEGA domain-containing protein [Myxococcales bacterium]